MPYALSRGTRLYFEEWGRGTPIVFVHEFSGDLESWAAQVARFSRRYRCIAFNARGYPPSEVPQLLSAYSYRIAADDIGSVMHAAGIRRAHVIGCSMGAYTTLQFGLHHARKALSLTLVGIGAGSDLSRQAQFRADSESEARRYLALGTAQVAKKYLDHPARITLRRKDPRGFAEFYARVAEHSALGSANTLRGIQARRPSLYTLAPRLARLQVPVHVVCGDEDPSALLPSVFLKRACHSARLTVVAGTGHAVNVEEPERFNAVTAEFLAEVDSGRWRPRDPRSLNRSTMARPS
ncbi:MAG TPA: alpha/beta hydrolase [Burkholderiales bacterium]|jgi:pimeloyl-ACP methyl ester carboxylesterase|nr:alpha/beta hydrolase [Burkholderiales bacterium]